MINSYSLAEQPLSHYAEKFNTYRFADYKEKVIDLLKRVCTVSVETVRIVGEMEDVI